jgi:hypothetical protein
MRIGKQQACQPRASQGAARVRIGEPDWCNSSKAPLILGAVLDHVTISVPVAAPGETKGAVHISRYRDASTTDRAPVATAFPQL